MILSSGSHQLIWSMDHPNGEKSYFQAYKYIAGATGKI